MEGEFVGPSGGCLSEGIPAIGAIFTGQDVVRSNVKGTNDVNLTVFDA